jgi:hypothetical protein
MHKGLDENFCCKNGFQYDVGEEYKEDAAKLCDEGFHACENPLDTFGYYPPSNSRYAEVELDEITDERGNDSKRCGKRIKICAEIGLSGIIDAFVKFVFEKVDWDNAKESNTGDQSAATNTGDESAATNTGYQSAATNTGYRSAATNTGDRSAATVGGNESIAIATGIEGKAKGALGCYIVLAEWEQDGDGYWHISRVKTHKVDGRTIKANTFYTLSNGKFIEAK